MTPELERVALDALREYLAAPPFPDGRTPVEIEAELDRNREAVIGKSLKPVVTRYLAGALSVSDFKRQIDSLNKQNGYWGFRGVKGQMFFNQLVNITRDANGQPSPELDGQLRNAISMPETEAAAASALRNLTSYVTRVGQQFIAAGGEPRSRPKESSIPFFLSYFWQVQRSDLWPVYYTNTVQVIEGMNLWQATGDLADDYLKYKRLHEELQQLFSRAAERDFTLYDVEHVFWFKGGRLGEPLTPITETRDELPGEGRNIRQPLGEAISHTDMPALNLDGYVPPIVAAIPRLALNDAEMQETIRRSGTTLERTLEKSVNAAFTILGYETKLLGQGQGRVPDGEAIAVDESYALLWDAKARVDGYRMGTDDRVIREYVDTRSRILKKARGIRNIYYVIVSSLFADEFDEMIQSLKMETHVNEVCLLEASSLVEIVNQKLRSPLAIGLGSDGIQRLFSMGGIIGVGDVSDILIA